MRTSNAVNKTHSLATCPDELKSYQHYKKYLDRKGRHVAPYSIVEIT
jgi:hypothetical protein